MRATTPSALEPVRRLSTGGSGLKDFFRVPNAIVDRGSELGPYGLAVAGVLARHANAEGECYPSFARIASQAGMSRGSAIKAIARLEKAGLIVTETRRRGFTKLHVYQFTGWTGETFTSSPDGLVTGTPDGLVDLASDRDQSTPQTRTSPPGGLELDLLNKTKEVSALEVARGVLTECSLMGEVTLRAIEKAAEAELLSGEDGSVVRDALVEAWRDQQKNKATGKLRFPYGPARFFGEGHWKDRSGWSWAEGCRPEPKARYIDPLNCYNTADYQPSRGAA